MCSESNQPENPPQRTAKRHSDAPSKWVRCKAFASKVWDHKISEVVLLYLPYALGAWIWFRPALPGVAAVLLGGVAAVMTFREMRQTQKLIFTGAMLLLIVLELRDIQFDRKASDKEHASEFQTMMERFEGLVGQSNEALRTMTGGDSFCYMMFTNGQFTESSGVGTFVQSGKYPLYDVAAAIVDIGMMQKAPIDRKSNAIAFMPISINVGNIASGTSVMWEQTRIPMRGGPEPQPFAINFVARNGSWFEMLRIARVQKKWTQALRVTESGKKDARVRLERIDPDFPANQLKWD